MNKATLLTLPSLIAALLTPVLSNGEDFLLYTPKPTEGDQAPASPDQGILVRSVTIKPGDTLAHLSRKYIGRGSWFPQVLLFNSIKNPDLIYTGDKLLVPVPSGQAAASTHKGAAEKKHARGQKRHRGRRGVSRHRGVSKPEPGVSGLETGIPVTARPEAVRPGAARTETVKPGAAKTGAAKTATQKPERFQLKPVTSDELGSYRQAKQAYLSGDYQKSLELFTEFLHKYPRSASSPDAALYRADSLLRLSGE